MKIEIDKRDVIKKMLKLKGKQAELKTAIKNAGLMAQADAKKNVPVDTGALKTSIGLEIIEDKENVEATIAVGKEYGVYVEYGTGERGLSTNKKEGITYTKGFKGQRAQPYFNPAIDKAKVALQKKIKKIGGKL